MKTRRFLLALAGIVVGVLALLAVPAAPAHAHASLVRTQPAQGSVVQRAPTEIVITFSEPVTPVPQKIKVIAPDGTRADRGKPTVNGADLHIPLRTDTPRGTFVVSYRVISADSHPVGAGFTYSVGAPSTTAPSASDAGTTNRVVSTAVKIAHYLGYAGLVLFAGPVLILVALWPNRLSRRAPTRLAFAGLGLITLATLLELYLEVPYSIGSGLFAPSVTGLTDELTSKYGQAHLARLVILGAIVVLVRPLLAGRSSNARRWLLALLAVAGVATWGYGAHPGNSTAPLLTEVADTAHLAAMAVWLGGLVMVLGYLLRQATGRELAAILPVWSTWAALAVSVLVLAGVAQALVEIGTFSALVHTSYGQLVLLKVVLLALVLAAAAASRRIVLRYAPTGGGIDADTDAVEVGTDTELVDTDTDTDSDRDRAGGVPPNDDGDARAKGGVRRLRRSVLAELLGAVVILGVAAVLVQTPPARTASADTPDGSATGVYATTLTSPLYQLQVDVAPARTGPNDIHLYAYSPVGAPMKILEWQVNATLPAQGIEPVDAVLTQVTDSHEIGQITLPTPGDWKFSFTLRTSEIDEATVTTIVTIK